MDNRIRKLFEKAAQELFKEGWELFWSVAGLLACIGMVCGGIFYSQMAIVLIIGTEAYGKYFSWALAIGISSLEVAGVKLFGNKERSAVIAETNKAEHKIIYWATIVLFIFDVGSTIFGLYLAANKVAETNGTFLGLVGWTIIIMSGIVMGIAEIFTGWMLRAIGTAYVSYKYAKNQYDAYNNNLSMANKSGRVYDDTQSKPPFQYNTGGDVKSFLSRRSVTGGMGLRDKELEKR